MTLNVIAPQTGNIESWQDAALRAPFDEQTLQFLARLSDVLLKAPQNRVFPELVALGFWLRPVNIKTYKEALLGTHKPLGNVIHFTPSNVDTMFVYSWVCSLLMGNRNIVRLATKESELKQRLMALLNDVLSEPGFTDIARANLFVAFERDSGWSERVSKLADARVIWGGDESVRQIRAIPASPRCRDIPFADRYSATVINGDKLIDAESVNRAADLLWKDSKPYLQQACSSPRIVFWCGDKRTQDNFFTELNQLAKQHQTVSQLNQHLIVQQRIAAAYTDSILIKRHAICAIELAKSPAACLNMHFGGGLFFVKQIAEPQQLLSELDEKCQTLTYHGFDNTELVKVFCEPSISGVDRIVPLGQALDFSPTWDGYDLLSSLSRTVELK